MPYDTPVDFNKFQYIIIPRSLISCLRLNRRVLVPPTFLFGYMIYKAVSMQDINI